MTIRINRGIPIDLSLPENPSHVDLLNGEKQLDRIMGVAQMEIFKSENYGPFIQSRFVLQKAEKKFCKNFLNELSSEEKSCFYQTLAKIWKRATGGAILGEEAIFGQRLAHYHCNDPIIFQAVKEFLSPEETVPLQGPIYQVKEDLLKISSRDSFSTEFTIYGMPNESPALLFAYECGCFAAKQLPFSSNYWRASVERNFPKSDERFYDLRVRYQDMGSMPFDLCLQSYFDAAHIRTKWLQGSLIANCADLSLAAFFYAVKERRFDIKVDLYAIRPGDHVFVVFNRAQGSDSKDPDTWGDDCFVLDTWSRQIYPAALLRQLLKDYKGVDEDGNPELALFNPSSQTLHLYTSSIFSLKDFKEQSTMHLPHIEKLLADLYRNNLKNRDFDKAREIREAIYSLPLYEFAMQRNPILRHLLSQMRYLLAENASSSSPAAAAGNFGNFNTFAFALDAVQRTGRVELLRRAVDAGAKCGFSDFYNLKGKKTEELIFADAFRLASSMNCPEILQLAIDAGAEPDADAYRRAFDDALVSQNLELLRMVVKAGAVPYVGAFAHACEVSERTGNLEFLDLMLKAAGVLK